MPTDKEAIITILEEGQELLTRVTGIATSSINFTDKIDSILGRIGGYLQVSRVAIFEYETLRLSSSNTFEWCAAGIESRIRQLQEVPYDDMHPWVELLREQEIVCESTLDRLPEKIREILSPQGVKSILVIRFEHTDYIDGFIGFEECVSEREWDPHVVKTLQTVAGIISSLYEQESLGRSLQESEQNFKAFFKSIINFIFVSDPDGDLLYANDVVGEKLVSYPEGADLTLLDYHPGEYRSEAAAILSGMEAGTRDVSNIPLLGKDGSYIPVESRLWKGTWNGREAWFFVSKDLTLQQTAINMFDTLFEQLPSPIALINGETKEYVNINSAFVRVLGYRPDTIIGRTTESVSLFIDPEAESLLIERTMKDGVYSTQTPLRRTDREAAHCLVMASLVQHITSPYIIITFTDISEEIAAKRMIQEQKAYIESIIEYTETGTWDWDIVQGRIRINDRFRSSLGYDGEHYPDPDRKAFLSLCHPDDRKRVIRTFREKGETRLSTEFRLRKEDGSYIWVMLSGRVSAFDEHMAPARMLGTLTDITHLKETEQLLIEERNRAEAAVKTQSDFLAMVSHEIRTPINTMMGIQKLLSMTDLDTQQRSYLERLDSAAHILLQTVTNILDLTKIRADRLEIERIPFLLEPFIHTIIDSFGVRIAIKKLDFSIYIAPDVPGHLFGDSFRILQVLTNLLSNAVKFTDRGFIRLEVKRTPNQTDMIDFIVEDTGIGMSEAVRQKIFQPFVQADASTTRTYGGTGLGLSICTNLIDRMGGRLSLESHEGEGSTFTVSLPALDPAHLQEKRLTDDLQQDLPGVWGCLLSEPQEALVRRICSDLAIPYSPHESCDYEPEDSLIIIEWGRLFNEYIKDRTRVEEIIHRNYMILLTTRLDVEQDIYRIINSTRFVTLPKPFLHRDLITAIKLCLKKREAPRKDRELPSKDTGKSRVMMQRRGKHILVCDDHRVGRLMLEELLQAQGYTVHSTDSGAAALNILKYRRFDLLLLDIQMPDMDGFEVIERIRKQDRLRNLRILILSADLLVSQRMEQLKQSVEGFVPKPVDQERLVSLLDRTLLGQAGQAPGPHAQEGADTVKTDLDAGLKRFGRNRLLFLKVTSDYLNEQEGFIKDLRESLLGQEPGQTARLLHGTRGVASNLGLTSYAQLLGELETTLRSGSPEVSEWEGRLVDLRFCLEDSANAFGTYRKQLGTSPATMQQGELPIPDREPDGAVVLVCAGLIENLGLQDPVGSMEKLGQLMQYRLPGELQGLTKRLQAHIAAYEFSAALKVCSELNDILTARYGIE